MAFAINGKFTSQPVTGVQRVAYELTRAMQMRVPAGRAARGLRPAQCERAGGAVEMATALSFMAARHAMGQITLPIAARGVTLSESVQHESATSSAARSSWSTTWRCMTYLADSRRSSCCGTACAFSCCRAYGANDPDRVEVLPIAYLPSPENR